MTHVTHSTKPISEKEITRSWHLFDLKGKVLGRVAQEISTVLQGKNKVNYAPYLDMGDNVIVLNATKFVVTGRRSEQKTFGNYSGYPGGLREVEFKTMMEKNPEEIVRRAISGMLPKNRLRDKRLARLFIFKDENHPYGDKLHNVQS